MSAHIAQGLIAAAAGESSQGDRGWHAEGTKRLYFEHHTDVHSAGMVDINEKGGEEPTHVRVELWVSPEIAAEIIAHVTGRQELAIRALVRAEVIQRETDRIREKHEPEKVHGDGLDVPASALRLEREDDAREKELTEIIKSTGGLDFGTDEDEKTAEIIRLTAEQKADDEGEEAGE